MKVISVVNIKGGVGKTISTTNVGAGLADKGYKVLMIDMDSQANLSTFFACYNENELTILDVFNENADIKKASVKINNKLSIVNSEIALTTLKTDLISNKQKKQHNILKNALEKVKDIYDYCIIDCAPDLSVLTVNAILASNEIIIPMKATEFSLQGYRYIAENLFALEQQFKVDVRCKLLFTLVGRNNDEMNLIKEVKTHYKNKVYQTVIRYQSKYIIESITQGKPVILRHNKKIKVAAEYRLLVDEILKNEV